MDGGSFEPEFNQGPEKKRPGMFLTFQNTTEMTGVQKSKDGVPQRDGDSATFQEYEETALQWEQSIDYHKRYLAGPRLVAELAGSARKHVMG